MNEKTYRTPFSRRPGRTRIRIAMNSVLWPFGRNASVRILEKFVVANHLSPFKSGATGFRALEQHQNRIALLCIVQKMTQFFSVKKTLPIPMNRSSIVAFWKCDCVQRKRNARWAIQCKRPALRNSSSRLVAFLARSTSHPVLRNYSTSIDIPPLGRILPEMR